MAAYVDIVAALLVIACGVWFIGKISRVLVQCNNCPLPAANEAAELCEELDAVTEEIEAFLEVDGPNTLITGKVTNKIRFGANMKCAAAIALSIQADLGMLKRTEANRLMVVRLASRLLEVRKVRKADSARILPLVELAVFTPSTVQVVGMQQRRAQAVVDRVQRLRVASEKPGWLTILLAKLGGVQLGDGLDFSN